VGTRPRSAPIQRPSRRCQSPISTANPNAVNVDTPRRHPSRVTTGGEHAVAGHHGDRGVEPVAAGEGDQHGVVGDVERQLQPGQRKLLGAQPALVHPGPRLALVVDDPLAQQQLRRPVPRAIRSERTSSRARTKSRAASCSMLGTATATISPRCSNRARCRASRTSVLIRSPDGRCTLDGAATRHSMPSLVRCRARPNPSARPHRSPRPDPAAT
jgi:hypothetical protein